MWHGKHERKGEWKLFGRNLFGPQDEDSEADEDVPDPSEFRKVANSIRSTPFSRKAIIPLSAAALAPMLIAGATQLPFKDLLKVVKSLVLF